MKTWLCWILRFFGIITVPCWGFGNLGRTVIFFSAANCCVTLWIASRLNFGDETTVFSVHKSLTIFGCLVTFFRAGLKASVAIYQRERCRLLFLDIEFPVSRKGLMTKRSVNTDQKLVRSQGVSLKNPQLVSCCPVYSLINPWWC